MRRALLAAAAALALAPAAPRAQAANGDRFDGRATVQYGGLDAPGSSSRSLAQVYEGRLRVEPSPTLGGQLQLRLDDARGTQAQSSHRTESDGQRLQPRAEARWRLAPVELKVGYDAALERSNTSASSVTRNVSQRAHATGTLGGVGLPAVLAEVASRTDRDVTQDATIRDTTARLATDHGAGPLRVGQSTQIGWFDDGTTGVATRTIQPRGNALLDLVFGKAGTLGASYVVSYTDISQEVRLQPLGGPAGETMSPQPRSATRGLYGVTDLPSDTTGRPLVPSPALIDGNREASTGISIGPDGVSFQNIGVDMGRLVSIDALRVSVRTSSGFPVTYGGGIVWSLYSSTDGLLWSPIGGASTSFDRTFSRFEALFHATTARYFKLVTFGTSATEAYVTEVEAFEHVLVRDGAPGQASSTTLHSTVLIQGAGVNATAAPHPKLRLAAGGSLSRASQNAPGSAFASTGWEANANVAAGPLWRGLTTTVTQEVRGSTLQRSSRLGTQTSTSVALRPLESVGVSGEAHRTDERGPGDALETLGGRVGVSLALIPSALDVSGSAGVERVRTEPDGVETDRTSASASASARLFPSVTLNATAAVQTGTVAQTDAANVLFPQPPASRVYTGGAQWRVSERLQLAGSLSYLETARQSGVAQQYRVAWDPFPGGAFRLGLAYDESIDAVNDSRLARFLVQPSWRVNRHATLDASWSDTIRKEPLPASHSQMFFLSFTLRT